MPPTPCPCTSRRKLDGCCGPYLAGAEPPDAEALMQSRFSAYALGRAEHLWRTLAPTHPDCLRPREDVLFEYRKAAGSARFRRLEVLDRRLAAPPGPAFVLFVARVFEKGRDVSFAELSTFEHDGAGWRYVSGRLREAAGLPDGLDIAAFEKILSE